MDDPEYDEDVEDALIEADGRIHDNLYYALTSLEEENRSEAKGHIEFVQELITDMKNIDAKGKLHMWSDYALYQQQFLDSLREKIQNKEHEDAIEIIDKMVFLDPLAFDDGEPNHQHPKEW